MSESKPKVAVCLYGQLRGDLETFSSIREHLVVPNEADVYVHTWSYKPERGEYIDIPDAIRSGIDFDIEDDVVKIDKKRAILDEDKLRLLSDILSPARVLIEEQVSFDPTRYFLTEPQSKKSDLPRSSKGLCTLNSIRGYHRARSQALTKLRAFEAIEDPYQYDVIFLTRNDLLFTSPIVLSPIDAIHFETSGPDFVFDMCYFGSPDSIAAFSQMHHHADEIYEGRGRHLAAEFNEWHSATFAKMCGLNVEHFPFSRHLKHDPPRYHRGIKSLL